MTPEALRPRVPSGTSGTTTGESRLLQERLRVFSAIAFAIGVAFYGISLALVFLGYEPPMTVVAHAAFLGVLGLLGSTWLYCRRRERSDGRLRTLDAVLLVLLSGLILFVPAGSVPEPQLRGMVMLLSVNLMLFTRAIFIPSSTSRTLAVSAAAALPLAAWAVANESVRMSVWKVAWLLAAIAVATAGSAVIYGLRRQVRHALQLGQYTLEEKLGEGGMGVVYRARHAMLARPTAVKLLRPERVGEASLRRFEREVQLTAGLSHPNTVSVFDFGRTPDGVFYYAMEYLDGLSLEEVVGGDGPQPPARVVHVLQQVLGALAEAHGIGLVHRDVKPGNVILCERGGVPDVAKVLDFGLVKDLEADTGLSRDGSLLGTPLYLAPEAIRSPAADARADIYSVGAVAYFLLTGRNVFEGATVIEICSQHLHQAPVPPSERLGRGLPERLEAWVLACLEKDPARRPRSAVAAADRLAQSGAGEWTLDDARAWWAGKGRPLVALRHEAPRAVQDAATLSRSWSEAASAKQA
jgi:tRNA A-37 threonylcarbamoyl transferase component Bud32